MTVNDEKIRALSEKESGKLLAKEEFRMRVKEIIEEHISSVDFMKKVREYAGMEMDSRMFTSAKYWIIIIITAVITSAIGVFLPILFK
ncbi:MAG: hypothetical protein WCW78_02725 [Candidatus Paceibacterota bacterium]|jgi:hypothetical protein